jgi:prepilin-type N-terminal cleavage/methylation domain-containing protein
MKRWSGIRQIGFTLLEGVITVAIIAILVAIGIPAYNGIIDNQRLKAAIEQLDADFRNTQTKAKATSVEYQIRFTPVNTYYVISNGETTTTTTKYFDGGIRIGNGSAGSPIKFFTAISSSETSSGTIVVVTSSGRSASIGIDGNGLITK